MTSDEKNSTITLKLYNDVAMEALLPRMPRNQPLDESYKEDPPRYWNICAYETSENKENHSLVY